MRGVNEAFQGETVVHKTFLYQECERDELDWNLGHVSGSMCSVKVGWSWERAHVCEAKKLGGAERQ